MQLKDDVARLRQENGQLRRERNLLQQSWEDMKRLHEEDQKEIGDLRAQQQQVELGWWQGQGRKGGWFLPICAVTSSVHLSVNLSTHPSIHPTVHLFIYSFVTYLCSSIHPSIH